MSLPALVSLEDFALRVGGISASDEDRAQAALDDASALVRAEAAENWVDDDDALEDVPDLIITIVVAVAIRAFRNPEGVRSETIGNYSVAYADSSTAVFLTEGERRLIRRAGGRTGIGSISIEGEWTLNPAASYVPVEGGGDDFPLGVSEGDLGWRLSGSN